MPPVSAHRGAYLATSSQLMDPRNLYIQIEHAVRSVQWDSSDGHEYFLVGDGEQFYLDRLQAALDRHFMSETVWASPSRHEAIVFERMSASASIAQHVTRAGSLTLFDPDLHRFLQITKTGVARQGALQASNAYKPKPLRDSA